jgi:O-antigen/teichoic acid export membrane protein
MRIDLSRTSHSESTTRDRGRHIRKTGVAIAAGRGLQLVASLVTVPLAIRTLGAGRFGVWLVLAAVSSIVGFADLGLPDAVVSAIAEAEARNDRDETNRLVNSAVVALATGALALALLVVALTPIVDWRAVLGAGRLAGRGEASTAVLSFTIFFLVGLPMGIVSRVLQALHRGHVIGIWNAVSAVVQVVSVAIAAALNVGLVGFVVALSVPNLVANAGMAVTLLNRFEGITFAPRLVSSQRLRLLARRGASFFALGVSAAIAYQTDTLIIAHGPGPTAVTQYGVTMRLFGMFPLLLSFFFVGLWPAYADARARGDAEWVRRAFRRSITAALAVNTAAAVALLFVGRPFIHAWAGAAAVPPRLLIVSAGLYLLVNAFSGPYATLLNALNILRFQVICSAIMAVANLTLSLVLVHPFGAAGPLLATVIAQTVFVLAPTTRRIRYELSAMAPK